MDRYVGSVVTHEGSVVAAAGSVGRHVDSVDRYVGSVAGHEGSVAATVGEQLNFHPAQRAGRP